MEIGLYDILSNSMLAVMNSYVSFVLVYTFCWTRRRYRRWVYGLVYYLLSFGVHLARRFALHGFLTGIPFVSALEPVFFLLDLLLVWFFFDLVLWRACALVLVFQGAYLAVCGVVKEAVTRLYLVTFGDGFPFHVRMMHEITLMGLVVLVLYLGVLVAGLLRRVGEQPPLTLPYAVGSLLPTVLFCTGYLLVYPNMYNVKNHYSALATGVLLFLVNVATCLLYIALYQRSAHLHYLNRYYEEQEQFLSQMTEQDKSMQKHMHDERKHYVHILGLLRQKEYDRLEEYVSSLHTRTMEMGSLTLTGNLDVDSVLNAKIYEAEQAGCRILVTGKLPGQLRINPVDLCILLGNALDNAVAACRETQERCVSIHFSYHKRMLLIRARNAYLPTERKFRLVEKPGESREGMYQIRRGMGLEIMEAVAKQYNGEIELRQEGQVFVTEMFLHDCLAPESYLRADQDLSPAGKDRKSGGLA